MCIANWTFYKMLGSDRESLLYEDLFGMLCILEIIINNGRVDVV